MYDFAIAGGGIVGISTAMQLISCYPDARIVVLEKEHRLAQHQTGHNSGVIHAGVYYKLGSLKAHFCLAGNQATKAFCTAQKIPWLQCGKMLVATTPLEMERMEALWKRSKANGLEREWLSAGELARREPNITGLGGIFVPSSSIVDYHKVTVAMARVFTEAGGEIRLQTEILGLREEADRVTLVTAQEELASRYLIACSGLMADRLVSMLGIEPGFIICPFRGEYFRLDAQHNHIVNHLIYPIPDPAVPFLGIHLTRTIDGGVTVGPNAVLAWRREGYRKSAISCRDLFEMARNAGVRKLLKQNFSLGINEMKNSFFKQGYLRQVQKYCPSLQLADLQPYPAGVRAQAVSADGKLIDDFLFVASERTLHVCNAPSPAATSAIPIGQHIVERVKEMVKRHPLSVARRGRFSRSRRGGECGSAAKHGF